MQKTSMNSKLSLFTFIMLLLISSLATARFGAGGGGGRVDFRGGDNVDFRGYNNNVEVNRTDINRVNVYAAPGNLNRGHYYWNGAYYNYYYNGSYYNNCEIVAAHWENGQWIDATQQCW